MKRIRSFEFIDIESLEYRGDQFQGPAKDPLQLEEGADRSEELRKLKISLPHFYFSPAAEHSGGKSRGGGVVRRRGGGGGGGSRGGGVVRRGGEASSAPISPPPPLTAANPVVTRPATQPTIMWRFGNIQHSIRKTL